jgi:hypothetical protein
MIGPYGKNVSKRFFSETTWIIETKLPRNDHWKVLYSPMLIYVLRWRPSWISDRHKKQKTEAKQKETEILIQLELQQLTTHLKQEFFLVSEFQNLCLAGFE